MLLLRGLLHRLRSTAVLDAGIAAAAGAQNATDAVVAILAPVVACNRTQIENGRTYLREIVFGDPDETYSRAARSLVDDTIAAIADAIAMHCHIDAERAGTLANVVIAVLFVSVAMHAIPGVPDEDVTAYLRVHVQAALPS